MGNLKMCVNTLNRITLISTKIMSFNQWAEDVCQYPKSDNSHFYGTLLRPA